jgi:plastocyanin
VYVSAVPAGTPAPADSTGPHTLAQKDQRFAPRVLPITVGTTVDFPNFDPIFHNVFSVSPVRRFDLGKYAQGKSRRVEFDREGLVNVFCDIHSSMAAWILVLPHHVFAQPAADGTFRLPDLPPGHYRLMVWHPDLPTRQRDVDLPAAGLSLELGW